MMKGLVLVLLAALAGCASMTSNQVSSAISGKDKLTVERDTGGRPYVAAARFDFDLSSAPQGDVLAVCVSQNVQNNSVTLSDDARQAFVPFFGMVSQRSTWDVGGGPVIKYISDDKHKVVAAGSVKYERPLYWSRMGYSVRFDLLATGDGTGLSLAFSHLEEAQLWTGGVTNEGYRRLGAWASAHPEDAVAALRGLAGKIHHCVQGN